MSYVCRGCNELLSERPPEGGCPRCGAPLFEETSLSGASAESSTGPAIHDETLPEIDRLDTRSTIASPARRRGELALVGRTVHVYRCDALLGRGGMGQVFLAHHRDLHRRCALKVLSQDATRADADYVDRFIQEGRAAAALVHPYITTVHAIGESDGLFFLEMEFLAGGTLQALAAQGGLDLLRAATLASQVADGLSVAHRRGIVHRDLKPDNVLLTDDGIPKIADFGLAKRVAESSPAAGRLPLAGTPNYMAPELFRGCPPTTASDVYALGITLYFLLTGRVPHASSSLSKLIREVELVDVPDLRSLRPAAGDALAECLRDMIAKDPERRIPNAQEAAARLRVVVGGMRDLDWLIEAAFSDAAANEALGITLSPQPVEPGSAGSTRRIDVALPNGRGQKVFLEAQDDAGQAIVHLYSICCRAVPQFYEAALRLNSEMRHGAIAVRPFQGEPHFCVVNSYPRATADPEEIRLSVLEISARADEVERLLTGQDVH